MRGRGGNDSKTEKKHNREVGSSANVKHDKTVRIGRIQHCSHCIDCMHVEKNVAAKSLSNLLHVREKTKDRVRWLDLDLAELGGSIPVEAESLSDLQESVSKYVRRIYMDPRATVVTDISKEVATTRQAFYYEVLQEIWVLDYRFRKIPLFKCDWVNHRVGGVKRDNLGLHIAFAELAFAHYHCTLHCTCLCKQRHLHILHL
ncbi:hypothetical protein Tco_0924173 [Tanacetum coccineum]|uniref:DUF4216 domain-containing protein n=1 Tax=Tanacetum coccineum TaxID=301880 RepID=A0ABQ5D462_9ASTR